VKNGQDRYVSFAELAANEEEGKDFRVRVRTGSSGIVVIAPHGGEIEAGTSEVADAVAHEEHTFYSFEGMKPHGNRYLHITSTRFDEPLCLRVVREARTTLVIHGCKGDEAMAYVGGLEVGLRENIEESLLGAGFRVGERPGLMGVSAWNLCNRTSVGRGAQIELTTALRDAMFESLTRQGRRSTTETFDRFVAAMKEALSLLRP